MLEKKFYPNNIKTIMWLKKMISVYTSLKSTTYNKKKISKKFYNPTVNYIFLDLKFMNDDHGFDTTKKK